MSPQPQWTPPAADAQAAAQDHAVRDHLKDEGFLDSAWQMIKSPFSMIGSALSGDMGKDAAADKARAKELEQSGTPEQRREFAKEYLLKVLPGASTVYKAATGNLAGAAGDVAGILTLGGVVKAGGAAVDAAPRLMNVVRSPEVRGAALDAVIPAKAAKAVRVAKAVYNAATPEAPPETAPEAPSFLKGGASSKFAEQAAAEYQAKLRGEAPPPPEPTLNRDARRAASTPQETSRLEAVSRQLTGKSFGDTSLSESDRATIEQLAGQDGHGSAAPDEAAQRIAASNRAYEEQWRAQRAVAPPSGPPPTPGQQFATAAGEDWAKLTPDAKMQYEHLAQARANVAAQQRPPMGPPQAPPPEVAPQPAAAPALSIQDQIRADIAARNGTQPQPTAPPQMIGANPVTPIPSRGVPVRPPLAQPTPAPVPPEPAQVAPTVSTAQPVEVAPPARTLAQTEAAMAQKQPAPVDIGEARTLYDQNGNVKSPELRGVEKTAANRSAKAQRFAQALHDGGITSEMADQIESGHLSDAQIQQGMAPRWGNIAEFIKENAPSAETMPQIIAALKKLEAAKAAQAAKTAPGGGMAAMKNYFVKGAK